MGKKNSSLTRVRPLLNTLLQRDDFLDALLWPFNTGLHISEPIECIYYEGQDLTIMSGALNSAGCKRSEHEKALAPPRSLLENLIKNPEKMLNPEALKKGGDKGIFEKRRQLLDGDSATKDKALACLEKDQDLTKKAWYIFEGSTCPDIYIETKSYILVGEGKRTERKLTTTTTWLQKRDQLIRHIDALLDREKTILSFFIVDRNISQKYGYDETLKKFRNIAYFQESLPHRSEKLVKRAMNSYIGYAYWQDYKERYGISFPDTL